MNAIYEYGMSERERGGEIVKAREREKGALKMRDKERERESKSENECVKE